MTYRLQYPAEAINANSIYKSHILRSQFEQGREAPRKRNSNGNNRKRQQEVCQGGERKSAKASGGVESNSQTENA